MKSLYHTSWRVLLCLLLLLTLVACQGNDAPSPEPMPQEKEMRILWDVQSASMVEGRALIENNTDLEEACTVGSGNKAIGIWSAYERNGEVTKNVLGEDGDVSLVYNKNTKDDNYQGWTYGEKAAYWTSGAKYTFNAYYPKDAIQILPSSDITTFVARYNTVTTQEDLMLAFTEASVPVNPAVPLQLHHALAALKFQFRFGDGFTDVNDNLTAFWLENTAEQGICMQGLLKFGTEGDGEAIAWDLENSAYAEAGTPFYQWADATGLPITTSTDNMATAYTTGSYAENNGWLLIIPQESDGTVDLCFQTKNGGDVVHRVRLPLKTGVDKSGNKVDTGTWFAPACRYAYSLLITPTAVKVTLGIAGWNELESSYDITF